MKEITALMRLQTHINVGAFLGTIAWISWTFWLMGSAAPNVPSHRATSELARPTSSGCCVLKALPTASNEARRQP